MGEVKSMRLDRGRWVGDGPVGAYQPGPAEGPRPAFLGLAEGAWGRELVLTTDPGKALEPRPVGWVVPPEERCNFPLSRGADACARMAGHGGPHLGSPESSGPVLVGRRPGESELVPFPGPGGATTPGEVVAMETPVRLSPRARVAAARAACDAEVEAAVLEALRDARGVQSVAARALGWGLRTLQSWVERHRGEYERVVREGGWENEGRRVAARAERPGRRKAQE